MIKALAILLLLTAGACAQSITIGMTQFPPDMHPAITSTSARNIILLAANRPMIGTAADGTPVCLLCTDLPSLDNGGARVVTRADGSQGMIVTYTLRPGLTWGDGTKLTARDVAFTYRVLARFSPPQFIESVTAPDDTHAVFTLRTPVFDYARIAGAFLLPAHLEAPIFDATADPLDYGRKSTVNTHPEAPGLWSGPYRVTAFRPNDSITLEPNPFWSGRAPYFRRVSFRLIENTAALQAALLAGDVDTVAPPVGLTLDQVLSLARTQAARFDFAFRPNENTYERLVLNVDNPLLADPRVRHALSMAIDRKTIVAKLFDGRYTPATGFMHAEAFGHDPAIRTWGYDPAAARALLAEAGFRPGADGILRSPSGARLSIDLTTTSGNRIRELVGQVIQTQMKAVSAEIVIRNEPARVMFGETLRQRRFPGMVHYEASIALGSIPFDMFASSAIPAPDNNWTGRNYGGWRDAAMDAALLAARAALDPADRRARWHVIQSLYQDGMPDIPLYIAASAIITPKHLTDLDNPARSGYFTGWIEDWRAR